MIPTVPLLRTEKAALSWWIVVGFFCFKIKKNTRSFQVTSFAFHVVLGPDPVEHVTEPPLATSRWSPAALSNICEPEQLRLSLKEAWIKSSRTVPFAGEISSVCSPGTFQQRGSSLPPLQAAAQSQHVVAVPKMKLSTESPSPCGAKARGVVPRCHPALLVSLDLLRSVQKVPPRRVPAGFSVG